MNGEMLVYQSEDGTIKLQVLLENETVWLTQTDMVKLFQTTKQNISLHIKNIFDENELDENAVVKEYLTTAADGKKYRTKHYNLDVIISVGYRVKSLRGTQFRIWATRVLKNYLLKGYALNQRIDRIENKVDDLSKRVDTISLQIQSAELPKQGVFFDGQVFDAYEFASKIIR